MRSNAADSGRTKVHHAPAALTLLKERDVKEKIREIVEGFLPAMAKIQETNESDEQKKRNSKEWLRSKLDLLTEEFEKTRG